MINVIGAGLPRTGTTSLKAALERLGLGPCHHMREIGAHPEQATRWRQTMDGPIDWDAVLRGYRAAVDWPSAHFWRPLARAYPDAKVILTVRDDQHAWYTSLRDTVFAMLNKPSTVPAGLQAVAVTMRPLLERIWHETFGTTLDEPMPGEHHAAEVFRRHTAEVTAALPAGRVLVYETGQGWEPLCGFLGVPVPAEPYPHLNDRQAVQARLRGTPER